MQDAGVISGRVAHAFDNVLTGILGFAELTLTQTEPRSSVRGFIEEVLRAAQNGVELTQQLHLFSRCAIPTAGPTTLAYAIEEEEARQRGLLEPTTSFTVRLEPDLPPVAIDASLLRQVLGQLLDNAREALTGPGTIALTARRAVLGPNGVNGLLGQPQPGPCVEVAVTDSGPGLSADTRRRLLHEPFFTTKPRHRGLGLPVVYRILEAHRGCFRLESEPGQGTTVRLFLPLAVDGTSPSRASSAAQ
jgi:signal transduction histidine kinase